jgi:hypothetical protein
MLQRLSYYRHALCLVLAVPLLLGVLGCGGGTTSTKAGKSDNNKEKPAETDKTKPPKGDPG